MNPQRAVSKLLTGTSWYDYRTGTTHHTNNVESFWKLFKNSVRSTHIHISKKHTPKYLSEFAYRANYRGMQNAMFDHLITPKGMTRRHFLGHMTASADLIAEVDSG
jgi:hypothetical protein